MSAIQAVISRAKYCQQVVNTWFKAHAVTYAVHALRTRDVLVVLVHPKPRTIYWCHQVPYASSHVHPKHSTLVSFVKIATKSVRIVWTILLWVVQSVLLIINLIVKDFVSLSVVKECMLELIRHVSTVILIVMDALRLIFAIYVKMGLYLLITLVSLVDVTHLALHVKAL